MTLLTLIAYGKYTDIKAETRDPDTDEFMGNLILATLAIVFLWPFKVIPLGAQLKTRRHQNLWYLAFCLLFLTSIILGLGAYLLVGILVAIVKATSYMVIAYRLQGEKDKAKAASDDYESWE